MSLTYAQRRQLPAVSGVYEVWSAEGECLYVGASRNIRKRLTSYHHRSHAFTTDCVIRWQACQIGELASLEQDRIADLMPALNYANVKYVPWGKGKCHPTKPSISVPIELKRRIETLAVANRRPVHLQLEVVLVAGLEVLESAA